MMPTSMSGFVKCGAPEQLLGGQGKPRLVGGEGRKDQRSPKDGRKRGHPHASVIPYFLELGQ